MDYPFGRIRKYFARLRSPAVGEKLEDEESKRGLKSMLFNHGNIHGSVTDPA
jgi:hypothetical protein